MATVKKRAKKMQGGGTAKKTNIPYPKDKNMSSQDSASFRMGFGQSKIDDGYSGITSNRYYEKGETALKNANAVKKMKKYREGGDVPCPPGGKCKKPSRLFKPSINVGASTLGGRGKGNIVTKADEEAGRKQRAGERIMSAAKKSVPQSTAPGVRPSEESNKYKKGSQSFFGRDRYESEAKYGKKVVKKSAVKKAKVGSKIVKSKKK